MRKLISLALILALSFQCVSKLGIITFYHFYQDYVIEEYCENKDQPMLECAGSCFLKKSLDQNSDDDKKNAETLKQIEIPAFLISTYSVDALGFSWLASPKPSIIISYHFRSGERIFHPPKTNVI